MDKACAIKIGSFKGFSWIRCEGKGTFLNSPQVKQFGEAETLAGVLLLVIDLESCTGMDSTFMGTLAGLATRLRERRGEVHITSVDEKNEQLLEDLGLDYLMTVHPQEAIWAGYEVQIRQSLELGLETSSLLGEDLKRHVLDCHQILGNLQESNREKFSTVIEQLDHKLNSDKKE